jgi:hypothetical protein
MDAPSRLWYMVDDLLPMDDLAIVLGGSKTVFVSGVSDFYVGEGGKYKLCEGNWSIIRTEPSLAAMEHAVATVWLEQKRLVPSDLYPHVSGVLLLCDEASKEKSKFENISGTRVLLAHNARASELADCKGLPVHAVCIGNGEHAETLSRVAKTSQILGLKMSIHSYSNVNDAVEGITTMFAAKSYSTNAMSLVQEPLWKAICEASVDIDVSHSILFVGKGKVAHARKFDCQSPLWLPWIARSSAIRLLQILCQAL